MPAAPFKIGKVFYTHYYIKVDGKLKKKWHRLDEDKNEAYKKFGELCERLTAKKYDRSPNLHKLSWSHFCEEYERYSRNTKSPDTYAADHAAIDRFTHLIGITTLDEFTAQAVERYRELRKIESPTLKDSSLNREIDIFKAMGNKGWHDGYFQANPMAWVRKKTIRRAIPNFFTDDEMKAIRGAAFDEYEEVLIELAYYTGMRAGELAACRWDHFDFKRLTVKVISTKDYEDREIPLHPALARILKGWGQSADSTNVLGLNDRAVTGEYLVHVAKKIIRRADLTGGIHRFRHTFGARLARNNVNLKKISQWMGHSDISTTARYTFSESSAVQSDFTSAF